MAKRLQIEAHIRDWLKDNLDFIEAGLTLIKAEYPVSNPNGTDGFIDILANDLLGQFVIIEIKRHKDAERSGINEVLKYRRLIKDKHQVGDDKIRIILLSTDWRELQVPYSELFDLSDLSLEAYIADWENNELVNKLPVKIFPPSTERIYSPNHKVVCFENQKGQVEGLNKIKEDFLKLGLTEYVVLNLSYRGGNSHVIYPFACYIILTQQSLQYYKNVVQSVYVKKDAEDMLEFLSENDCSDENAIDYIEGDLLSQIGNCGHDASAGDSTMLDGMIGKGWAVNDIVKSGLLAKDPRVVNDYLIRELRGLEKENLVCYINSSKSIFRSRIKAIQKNALNCLIDNPIWHAHLTQLFKYISQKGLDYEMAILVYNPPSLLTQIYYMNKTSDFMSYMPMYTIQVLYEGETQDSFFGTIEWNNTLNNNYISILNGLENDVFSLSSEKSNGDNNEALINSWGLEYRSVKIDEDKDYDIDFDTDPIEFNAKLDIYNLPDFLQQNKEVKFAIERTFKNVYTS